MKRLIVFLAIAFSFTVKEASAQQDLQVLKATFFNSFQLKTKEIFNIAQDSALTAVSATSSLPTTDAVKKYVTGKTSAVKTTGTVTSNTYSSTVTLNFSESVSEYQTLNLTGNVTLATSNLVAGRPLQVRIVSDGSIRNLTFPAGWTFVGSAAPTTIAASKTALLTIISYGTTDANVVARWLVQP